MGRGPCDLAPSLTARHLLTYLELAAGADETGCVRVDFDCLCERVTGGPDRALCAQLVSDLVALVLPERDAPYSSATSARVLSDLVVYTDEPARLAINAVDAMVCAGSARVRMARCGAGFGARAVPVDLRLCADLEARDGWAQEQLAAAARRSPARHQRHVAA